MNVCPCHSGALYSSCCAPYHSGTFPKSALLLMRSRYSAYALGKAGYIMETTHPAGPHYLEDKKKWKEEILSFSHTASFDDLSIVDFEENGDTATVTFITELTVGEQDATFQEKSFFEKVEGCWLYKEGLVGS